MKHTKIETLLVRKDKVIKSNNLFIELYCFLSFGYSLPEAFEFKVMVHLCTELTHLGDNVIALVIYLGGDAFYSSTTRFGIDLPKACKLVVFVT